MGTGHPGGHSDSQSFVTTQWGSLARPFRGFSKPELEALLVRASALADEITRSTGVPVFLTYGCLLGAARSGDVIPHDFDIDFGFLAVGGADEVLEAARKVICHLTNHGFNVEAESNGQFKAARYDSECALVVEFFACWVDRQSDEFNHYFAVRHARLADAIAPLGRIELRGVSFPAPAKPAVLLQAIYGSGWKTPDPHFRYQLKPEDWLPFKFLFIRNNQQYWDRYYAGRSANRVWAECPTQFAALIGSEAESNARILDIGCGNGRDAIFFATLGLRVAAMDYSSEALKACSDAARHQSVEIDLGHVNLGSIADVLKVARQNRHKYDIIYARFLLHAISESAQVNVFRLARECLLPSGRIAMEYRCAPPVTPQVPLQFENGFHYRRLIVQNELHSQASDSGLAVQYSCVGFGLAKFRSEDPLVGRSILVRTG